MVAGRGLGKKGEGIKKNKLAVTNSHRDVKYSIGNIDNNTVITMYGTRWVLEMLGKYFVKYRLSNHDVVHLKLVRNNIECQL